MINRSLLIALTGILIISSNIFGTLHRTSNDITANSSRYFERQMAQNIAQSGVNMALRQLPENPSWRGGFSLLNTMGGKVTVQLADTLFTGIPAIRIRSIGILNQGTKFERQDTCTAFAPAGFIPSPVKAAITTNNPVTTLGTLIVDGRDHTLAGALIALQGTLGVWTTKTLSQGGNSKIGGTSGGIDYVPAKPGNPNTYLTSQVWPGGYPGTPDSLLGGAINGYPEGFLKALAQSGIGGSQYVTNPSLLRLPLKNVTYVELPSGGVWQSMNISGSGVLVVHNSQKNAAMKNLNSGTFTGLMIVDDPVHIHTTIIGAIAGLTPSPSEGNCIGNSSGNILFSGQAIKNATAGVALSGTNGTASIALAWWE